MKYDVIVIGAGHNGLVCAALLAKAGKRVVVVERRDVVGGLCAGVLQETLNLRPSVVRELALEDHGLTFESGAPSVFLPQRDGPGLLLSRDPQAAADEIARHAPQDAERYAEYHRFIAHVRVAIEPLLDRPPLDLQPRGSGGLLELMRQGLAARRLGKQAMLELLRIPPMCVADWLREWFRNELLCAGLAQPAIAGCWLGPWSGGSAANLLIHECTAAGHAVCGGAAGVVSALERAARSYGVEIRTDAEVAGIITSGERATGVELSGGETLESAAVVSSCDPKTTFLGLLPARLLAHRFEQRIDKYRMRGTSAHVRLELSRSLEFASRPGEVFEHARTGERLDDLERAFDAVKYRRLPERPMLDIRAPAGQQTVSILAHFVAYEIDGGWNDRMRERLGDLVVAELARFAPGIRDGIVEREVLTPADIEVRYGVRGGQIHHGEHALDQLLTRPTPECARYASPIEGLYLCGAGTHPGGGVSGAPGRLAARAVTA